MICNKSITVYHKGFDNNKIEKWTRFNYNYVWFDGGKGAGINKGYENANDFDARIWYEVNDVNISNFSIGDIVVPCHLELDITNPKQLKAYDMYAITSIKDNTYGLNQHVHIGGK